jgi:ribonucleoside-diphosphate reductase beta chain
MLLKRDLLPLKDYHKAKRLMWNPQDLSYAQDQQDWAAMNEREHDLVRRALSLFLAGETYVTHDLAPLLVALRQEGGHLEEEMFLTTQLFEESKHVEFFADVLEQVVVDVPSLADIAGGHYQELFEVELASALGRLLTDPSRPAQVEAVVTYHIIIEGVLAETGYYGIFTALKKNGLMPGLVEGLEYVQRDEARHIAFGLHLLSRILKEAPQLWGVVEARTQKLMPLAQGVFLELLEKFLPEIPFGLDLNDIVGYAGTQFMARMSALERVKIQA